MSKKVKCLDCAECMRFAIPMKKYLEENTYLVDRLKNSLVCGYTMKTKNVDNEQYCKHYWEGKEFHKQVNSKEYYNKQFDTLK